MIYFSGVFFFFCWGSALAFFQLISLEKIVGQALFERDVGRRCGDVMTIAWTLWSYSMPEHVHSFSPGFREKSPKLLLVSTNGAICLDVASTSKRKWRFRLESPCRPQPKNGDVFLVLLETRLKKVVTQGEMRAMPSVVTWCSAWREMTAMRCLFHTSLWHFQRFSFWGDGKLRDNRVL